MASDSRLPILIFAVLVSLIAIPFLISHLQDIRRPVLAEARVVTATGSDPVYRTGGRVVEPNDPVTVAVAVRVERRSGADQWLAPVDRLAIDGRDVEHEVGTRWPDGDRVLRVFWFTVESAVVGGDLDADNAADRLRYRTFLAPEMGRGLLADQPPSVHNDDHLGLDSDGQLEGMGTFRPYARVELVAGLDDRQALEAVTTLGVDSIGDPRFPTIRRRADLGENIHPAAGELFGLSGFEPRAPSGADPNLVTMAALGRTFSELVEERLVVSSETFAATAVTGSAVLAPDTLRPLGPIDVSLDRITQNRSSLRWGWEVVPGDLLRSGPRWIVLQADEGNGLLDAADTVLYCWRRPPERTTLLKALGPSDEAVTLLRYGQ